MNWARRLKRVFGVQLDACARCAGKLEIIASIEEPQLIAKILSHLQRVAPIQYQAELPLGAHPVRYGILVRMTRFMKRKPAATKVRGGVRLSNGRTDYWPLQDAKARFSELVRKVRSDGPQHVTVHGRDEVVVIAAEEFRRLKGSVTGKALVEVMRASPHRDAEIEPGRGSLPVRDVPL